MNAYVNNTNAHALICLQYEVALCKPGCYNDPQQLRHQASANNTSAQVAAN